MADVSPICPSCNAEVIGTIHTGQPCAWWRGMSGELFPSVSSRNTHPFAAFCPCDTCFTIFQDRKRAADADLIPPLLQMADTVAEEDAVKAMVDGWDEPKQALVYKYLYLLGMRIDKAESLLRKRQR